ncbi:alpha/beta hydrolase [Duganella radicis]|uniref:Alpha/beta hydrolase fold domain-containing protein n=1 Tax=Duganella radicis TaxID=551988 RepID=A0A6L6PP71_9BURK|nr:alpha/beta hydrolase [Duganella radicis]MTV40793.1 alpha/beta hydrolase fold domain-containing protein [Duganella radicis]
MNFPLLPFLLFLLIGSAQAQTEVWQPSPGQVQQPIWPGAVPDAIATPKAESVDRAEGHGGWSRVNDVSVPTMTVYSPKSENTGAAVVVFPGGGFQVLAMDLEGSEICDWLTSRGITCVLLKYRVPKGNHHWDEKCQCHITPKIPRALQDAQRTIRLVRSKAQELHLNPGKIGVIGFSAGGYLVAQTSNIFTPTYKAVDAADKLSSRPDFAIALYPGHLCRAGDRFDSSIHVTAQTPPTFLLQAWDDPVDPICNSMRYARELDRAGVPAEVHLFAKGGHAFGLRDKQHPVSSWPSLVENWLKDIGVL